MATYTSNYNLKKPADNDYYNIEDFNGNADLIDTELKNLNDELNGLAHVATSGSYNDLSNKPTSMTPTAHKSSHVTGGTDVLSAADIGAVSTATYTAHTADYVRQPAYAATGGTSTAYNVTLSPAPSSVADGFSIVIVPHITCGASPTLNINSLGAVTLKRNTGDDFIAGNLVAGKPYQFIKVGTYFYQPVMTDKTAFSGYQFFTTSTTFTASRSGLHKITCQGKGGNGAAHYEERCGGGGAGGTCIGFVQLVAGASYAVVVTTSESSFNGTLIANAGSWGTRSSVGGSGGDGGTASGGFINITGQAGDAYQDGVQGAGGNSLFGFATSDLNHLSGVTGYGAGGRGNDNYGNTVQVGGPGFVLIEW